MYCLPCLLCKRKQRHSLITLRKWSKLFWRHWPAYQRRPARPRPWSGTSLTRLAAAEEWQERRWPSRWPSLSRGRRERTQVFFYEKGYFTDCNSVSFLPLDVSLPYHPPPQEFFLIIYRDAIDVNSNFLDSLVEMRSHYIMLLWSDLYILLWKSICPPIAYESTCLFCLAV